MEICSINSDVQKYDAYSYVDLYAPQNPDQNLRNEILHTYIQMSVLFVCKKEICICIKIRSLVMTYNFGATPIQVYEGSYNR
jgi:hypothetical protein